MHPIIVAIIVVDLVGSAAIGVAMLQSLRLSLGWSPSSASSLQLRLERYAEEASAAGRLGLVLHALATLAVIGAANHLLPALVPGAMCGTGVMQAMPDGWLAAAMRTASVTALLVWVAVDRLNRASPMGPLALQTSRIMLLAGALAIAASWRTASSLFGLDVHRAVSCCAAVYDLASTSGRGWSVAHVAGPAHAGLLGAIGVVLLIWPKLASSRSSNRKMLVTGGVLASAFVFLGGWVLVDWTGPVVYGTLAHRCPMCMFLPRHGAVGYAAFGLLAWIAVEASSAIAVVLVSQAAQETRQNATERAQKGWRRVAVAAAAFLVIALIPPIAWWMHFGVWIGG
jgi:hypothetical protein